MSGVFEVGFRCVGVLLWKRMSTSDDTMKITEVTGSCSSRVSVRFVDCKMYNKQTLSWSMSVSFDVMSETG